MRKIWYSSMVFSGITFLYYFLPCVLLFYFAAPFRFRNGVLLAASLLFYAWGEPVYVLLMLFVIAAGYGAGIWIEKSRSLKSKGMTPRRVLSCGVILFTGVLLFFKYADFFIINWNRVTGAACPLLRLALPIGISFYTFQILSYLTDVYRGEVRAQKNIISFALYVSMFPQLIAGPIVRYQTVAEQIQKRRTTWEEAEYGISRFVIGLSKKVLIANELGELCEIFRVSDEKSVVYYWMYATAFCLHIYFDFSGYSDMAIGLGRIFGFSFPENFRYPYVSKSITEFWRRWHMSLGTWFRDYVYIPLGGSRVSVWKRYRNIFLVWMLTGLWHGASWNFVVWGLYFGILLVLEKCWILKNLEKIKWLSHFYVLFLVAISFVIFHATDLTQAAEDIRCLLGLGGIPVISAEAIYYLKSYGVTLLLGGIGSTPFVAEVWRRVKRRSEIQQKWSVAVEIWKPIVLVCLLLLCTAYLADGSFNPFLYFRF